MTYKLNLKAKSAILYALFNNFVICVIYGALIFAITTLIGIWILDIDLINKKFIISFCFTLAIAFLLLMVIYAKSKKNVEVTSDYLIIDFGYFDYGKGSLAKFKNKINLSDITDFEYFEKEDKEIKRDFAYYVENNKYSEYRIVAGDYNKPYVSITVENKYKYKLLLPTENAKELYNTLHKRSLGK